MTLVEVMVSRLHGSRGSRELLRNTPTSWRDPETHKTDGRRKIEGRSLESLLWLLIKFISVALAGRDD
jgi:hypothetical protein